MSQKVKHTGCDQRIMLAREDLNANVSLQVSNMLLVSNRYAVPQNMAQCPSRFDFLSSYQFLINVETVKSEQSV